MIIVKCDGCGNEINLETDALHQYEGLQWCDVCSHDQNKAKIVLALPRRDFEVEIRREVSDAWEAEKRKARPEIFGTWLSRMVFGRR